MRNNYPSLNTALVQSNNLQEEDMKELNHFQVTAPKQSSQIFIEIQRDPVPKKVKSTVFGISIKK